VDYFGWCTWDAFYLEVSTENVLGGLASFQRGGVSPRVLILDGGWQQEKDEQLWSFEAKPDQFPGGLKPLVDKAKIDYGVKIFGAWHTLQGFWNGVHPDGELGNRYQLVRTEGIAYNMPDSGVKQRSLVHPDEAGRFFDDYHRTLREQGVNMVKVDNQAALDHFSTPEVPPTTPMRAYQNARQNSAAAHFQGESLHCMSHSTDLAYDLQSAMVWRSSQDFFPSKPETQALHIFDNAINSVWVQTFALPDWDMFQSGHPAAAFHAAARAISGGPVYVSDKPGQHDFALLSKLVVNGGRVLRSRQPALPAREGFFEDGRATTRVAKIVNHNDVDGLGVTIGVLGLFNCYYNGTGPKAVSGEYSAGDVPGITGSRFALYHHFGGNVAVTADAGERFPISLDSLNCELVTISPVERGVALFGLLDKFNGSRAIESARRVGDDELEVVLVDGGRFGWHSKKRVISASRAGIEVEIVSRENLTWVQLPEGNRVTLLLRFE
jgi:raffinose synthase